MCKPTHIILATTLSIILIACDQPKPPAATTPAPENNIETNCYQYQTDKDTIQLQLNIAGDKVSGSLVYKLHEKDRNTGTLKGNFKGDTLIADYLFDSEGSSSIRQIAFLRQGDLLLEGYGESIEKDGQVQFKDPATLSFSTAFSLKKTTCNP